LNLFKDAAPFTVMSFLKLASQRGFYRGLSFHRVVSNFVIQGGDPHGDGWGGPGYTIRSEFSPLSFDEGELGMASAGKDTEGSQFFVTQSPQPHLDGRYTIFGKVVSGMDVVNRIQIDDRIFDISVQEIPPEPEHGK
jgi:cyclophilin family peptidyl-prolyl cis-trans isomerase